MAALLFPLLQVEDASGNPLSGAKLYFYTTGTSTPQSVYTTSALSVAHANPVVADAAGRFPAMYGGTTDYKAILKDSADVTILTLDPLLVPSNSVIIAQGDLIIGNASGVAARLVIGAADRVLLSSGTTASWEQINLATSGVLTGILSKAKGGLGSAVAAPVLSRITAFTDHTIATPIPHDDTIPQITEGVQIWSQAYTASTAANRIRITAKISCAAGGAETGCIALFVDGAANAVDCRFYNLVSGAPSLMELEFEAAQSAGAHTYVIRAGTAGGANLAVNGTVAAGRRGGGVQASTLTIEELPTS